MQSLLLLLLLLLLAADAAGTYQPFLDCAAAPFTCGNLTINVSYPFRLSTRHDYCGSPGFLLTCTDYNSTMTINIGDDGYQVKDVDYLNHLLTVVDTNLTARPCPRPYKNTTVDPALFWSSDRYQTLTVFIGCNASSKIPAQPAVYGINCLSGSYFVVGNRSLPGLSESCSSTVVVPVNRTAAERMANGALGFREGLQEGFTLGWMPGKGWCRDCVNSGGICGYNYSAPDDRTCYCRNGLELGTCSSADATGMSNVKNILIGVGVGGTVLTAAFLMCLLWYQRKKRRKHSTSSNILIDPSSTKYPELGGANFRTHIFSYDELDNATNGFDETRELGDGGFGTVYEGKLRDGRTVAVKRLYESNGKRVEQFMNEVDILSGLRHKNLVTLYGCTSRHSRELLLVYEFVSNGTVADHLHGPRVVEGGLAWPVRMGIAIETADALTYLHAAEPQIIHRDVKTNNILLDDGFHVKVGDFGLSRLFPLDATHVSTLPQGTPGYVDPAYHQCYQLTDKSDVYSFGVVLVELISSKPAVDIGRSWNEINLASLAINRIQSRELDQLVDPGLGFRSDAEKERMITLVAELAFRCLQGDREMRPPIKEVLEELRWIQSGGLKEEKASEADAPARADAGLPKNVTLPFSPDSVAAPWGSRSTTPDTSV